MFTTKRATTRYFSVDGSHALRAKAIACADAGMAEVKSNILDVLLETGRLR